MEMCGQPQWGRAAARYHQDRPLGLRGHTGSVGPSECCGAIPAAVGQYLRAVMVAIA